MLNLTGSLKVYVATERVDLRKSSSGLYAPLVSAIILTFLRD